jgi:hypothetical protein
MIRLFAYIILFACLFAGCREPVTPNLIRDRQPAIFPDYSDIVFPPNLAPPNFRIDEEGDDFVAEIGANGRVQMTYRSSTPEVCIRESAWRQFADENAGAEYFVRISVKQGGQWVQWKDIVNRIARQPIDPYLVYRLLYPGYELWNEMGIYQRDLTSFDESAIVENKSLEKGCVNCHTFCRHSPDTMLLHVRGKMGGTVIRRHETTVKKDIKISGVHHRGAYASWHPSGKFIAYSAGDIKQFFHLTGKKPVEVSDLESDLIIYDVEADRMFADSAISGRKYLETYPDWSPDGRSLYFCRTDAILKTTSLDSIRYDLYRISFDPDAQKFGTPECIYHASGQGKTVALPRVSPDGKYLMCSMFDYGNFGIWHPESELSLLNLTTGEMRVMDEVNSPDVESFHTWSSSGRWFVFSSKRLDGLWARPYFAYFDPETGNASKPFLLPQKDPNFYDYFTKTYNLPELIKAPIMDKRKFYRTKFE